MLHLNKRKTKNTATRTTIKYVTPVIILGVFLTGLPVSAQAKPLLPVETHSSTLTVQTAYASLPATPLDTLNNAFIETLTPSNTIDVPTAAVAPGLYTTELHTKTTTRTVKKKIYRSAWKDFSIPYAVAHSPAAKDKRGAEPSLYRGIYFHPDQERFRLCVGNREGSFAYMVRGGGGNNYYGTYQFHKNFQNGIPYMMAKESRRTGDGLVKDILKLRYIPINKWNRYYQDRAFFTVVNYDGKWSGKHHWNSRSHSC